MNGKNALMNAVVLAILLLSVISPLVVFVRAAESITTDKGLYAIKWREEPGMGAVGYVNATVTLTGLDPEIRYEIAVFKFHGPAGLNYVREVYGVGSATINFTIPPTMDARPSDIAGTWNASLYKIVGQTRSLIKYVNFGIWAINARLINFGRVLQVWGGGFKPGTKVNFTVSNAEDITEELFGSSMAYCPVSGVTCVVYGTFSNTSSSIVDVPMDIYNVELVNHTLMPTVISNVTEDVLTFNITDQLLVNILSPANASTWHRTDTIPVEVEVLYQDLVPVTAGEVNVTFTPPAVCDTQIINVTEHPEYAPKTIDLTYNPVSKTWKGSLKIQNNNSTGVWNVTALAADYYGNHGEDNVTINVEPAIIVVESVTPPPASVPRASWISWVIKAKYKGDNSSVDLDLPKCTVYVVNATTEAVVGSAYVTKVGTGLYNVTWWVPADAPLGEYRFLISPNALFDKVTTCDKPNRGPEAKVLSPPFVVGVTALKVVVDTYSAKDVTKVKKAFAPGSIVWIGAKVTYADSGVIMSAGTVRASIYNATGGLIDEIPMTFDSTTRMWWCSWDSTGFKAGRYTVVVKARDLGYNVGEGSTYFYLSGLSISPTKGTVPPIEYTKCENITKAMDEWLVTASIFTDPASGKRLGTEITIEGIYMTANSKVNVTVDWLPYPAGAEKILLLMNVPTDAEGNFVKKIVFPTTIMGTYKITAVDAKGVTMEAIFEVIPGMILTPDPVVGSALIKVIATGLPSGAYSLELLVNGTDAMTPLAYQSFYYMYRWLADVNGTLQSRPIIGGEAYTVKPGFVIPFTEPGTYVFDLPLYDGVFYNCTSGTTEPLEEEVTMVSDSVKVVNAFKEFTLIVDKIDDLMTLLTSMNKSMNAVLTSIDGNVASLVTDVGTIKTSVGNLVSALSSLNAMVTDVKDDVATIVTDVGTVKTNVGNLASLLNSVGAKVDSVSGDVATIKTDVGTIKASVGVLDTISSKLDSVSGKVDTVSGKVDSATSAAQGAASAVSGLTTAVWIAVILSLIAAIASIVAIIQVSRKIAG